MTRVAKPVQETAVSAHPENATATMAFEDMQELAEAVRLLERTSLAARFTRMVGDRLSGASLFVPAAGRRIVAKAVEMALHSAMKVAIRSLGKNRAARSPAYHKSLASVSGAAGGVIGIAALPVELPVSTVLILRAIADTARANGEDLTDPATAMACMEVFAMGGRNPDDDLIDSSYFAVRTILAKTVSDAAKYVAAQSAAKDSAPILVRLMSEIASRFGIAVSQKAAAQAVPVVGAIGGAAINYAFIDHFQGMARGHFTVRRLERMYGAEPVRLEYERLQKIWVNGPDAG